MMHLRKGITRDQGGWTEATNLQLERNLHNDGEGKMEDGMDLAEGTRITQTAETTLKGYFRNKEMDDQRFKSGHLGYIAAECFTKKSNYKVKAENVNLCGPLTPKDEVGLVNEEISRKATIEGTINGTTSDDILLDTGAGQTVNRAGTTVKSDR